MPYFQSGSHPDQKVFYIDKGEGDNILFFIHGWYQSSRDCFGPLIDQFEHTHRVIAIDLPGHGSSYKHPAGDYSLLSAYRAVEDLLLKLQKEKCNITLIGHSLGAFLALKIALLHQHQISQMVLISPVLEFSRYQKSLDLWQKIPSFLLSLVMRIMALFGSFPFGDRKQVYSTEKGHRIPGKMEYYRIKTANHPSQIARQYMRSFEGADLAPILRNISIPTLVLYGSQDRLTPPALGNTMSESLPLGLLKVIEQGGHNIQLNQSEQVITQIQDFIDEHQKKRFNWRKIFTRRSSK